MMILIPLIFLYFLALNVLDGLVKTSSRPDRPPPPLSPELPPMTYPDHWDFTRDHSRDSRDRR
jgi:hypothetical protein